MFTVDPLADDTRRAQYSLKQCARRIFAVVVVIEKSATFEVDVLCQTATTDDECGVARQSPLRSNFAPVPGTAVDFLLNGRGTGVVTDER